MRLDDLRVCVSPGRGLVARFPRAALFVLPDGRRSGGLLDELCEVCQAAATGARAPGKRLTDRVAKLVAADPAAAPPLGLVADAGKGLAVVLHGDVELTSRAGDRETRLERPASRAVLDGLIDRPFDRLTMGPSGRRLRVPDPRLDLRAGVVAGGGIVLTVPEPAERAEPKSRAEPAPVRDAVLLGGPPVEPRAPLPVDAPVAPSRPETGPLVRGIECKRGHFNPPLALFCSACGMAMVHATHHTVQAPRPPLGRLILDDGSAFDLDADYMIGRQPRREPAVTEGRMRPLTLATDDRTVSRVHAAVRLDGWDVILTGRSRNGTYVRFPGSTEWVRLSNDEQIAVRPGSHVRIGRHEIVFEGHFEAHTLG